MRDDDKDDDEDDDGEDDDESRYSECSVIIMN